MCSSRTNETAVSMEDELKALLRQHHGRSVLVVDESFHVKNLDAQRTRAVRRLREWCDRGFRAVWDVSS
jgi:hypothetical protein